MEEFAAAREMKVICGPTLLKRNGYFGNLFLTAYPSLSVEQIGLSVIDREPRGAIDANLDIRGVRVRLIATHLGLRAFERKIQVKRLLRSIPKGDSNIIIVIGDINEWFPASKALQRFSAHFGCTPTLRTFPSRFPGLALDRIWVQPAAAMNEIQVYNTPSARIASDHLPLKAKLVLP